MVWVHPRDRKPKYDPQRPLDLFKNKQWQEFTNQFLCSLYQRSGSGETVKSYQRVLLEFFRDPMRTPENYTSAEAQHYLSSLTRRGLACSPAMYNIRLKVLRVFYARAAHYTVRWRGKPRPLFRGISPVDGLHSVEEPRKERELSMDDLHRLFDVIPRKTAKDKRDYALFLAYFATGRRRKEICQLRWGNIRPTTFENGRKGYEYVYRRKGHSREERARELHVTVYEAIREYLVAADRWDTIGPNDPIFITTKYHACPDASLLPGSINMILRKYVKLAGVDWQPHDFRRMCARLRYEEEKDLAELQKFLDHLSPNTTIRYLAPARKQDDLVGRILSRVGHL